MAVQNRKQLLQALIDKYQFKSYLEIGVYAGKAFFEIRCRKKFAVDPRFAFNPFKSGWSFLRNSTNFTAKYFQKKSDDFFRKNADSALKNGLDISLVDGYHDFTHSLNDVLNVLKYLNPDGIIVVHDSNPPTKQSAGTYDEWERAGFNFPWNGDVWKTIYYLIKNRPDLEIKVLDVDFGLGMIRKKPGNNIPIPPEKISRQMVDKIPYEEFSANRKSFINLVPVEEGLQGIL